MAGEHSFPTISPKGSKAPESNDLRGQMKFKLLTASEDFVFPGNYKGETLLGKTVYLIIGTNEKVRRKFDGLRVFRVSEQL